MKYSLILFASFLLVVTGCRNRKVVDNEPRDKGLSKMDVLRKQNEARADFKTMYFKGKADLKRVSKDGKEEDIGFSYKTYIAKDSLIWTSISKFGIPAAIVLIDRDSVRMRVSVPDKFAIECDFKVLSNMLGVDVNYGLMESFFTGDPALAPDRLKLVPQNSNQFVLTEERPPYEVSWFLNGRTFKLNKMTAKDPNLGSNSTITYSEFESVKGQMIPGKAVIEATQGGEVRIELEHSTIEIEPDKTNFRFRIPDSYERRDCSMQ